MFRTVSCVVFSHPLRKCGVLHYGAPCVLKPRRNVLAGKAAIRQGYRWFSLLLDSCKPQLCQPHEVMRKSTVIRHWIAKVVCIRIRVALHVSILHRDTLQLVSEVMLRLRIIRSSQLSKARTHSQTLRVVHLYHVTSSILSCNNSPNRQYTVKQKP